MATASITLIETATQDTIRVLELCNVSGGFNKLASVKILPAERPNFTVALPLTDIRSDCRITKTYYGHIQVAQQ